MSSCSSMSKNPAMPSASLPRALSHPATTSLLKARNPAEETNSSPPAFLLDLRRLHWRPLADTQRFKSSVVLVSPSSPRATNSFLSTPRLAPARSETQTRPCLRLSSQLLAPNPRITAVQRALADFGYGQIRPSGAYDSATRTAIERFEREHAIPVTGQISDRLVRELSAMTGRPLE